MVCVTTKATPDTVHSPTPGQLHVEGIQLAFTFALCCCYALCMKREELLIFYSFWLRCLVVMMQYVGFLGRSQRFGSGVKVGAPTWHLARANLAREVWFWRAPTAKPLRSLTLLRGTVIHRGAGGPGRSLFLPFAPVGYRSRMLTE